MTKTLPLESDEQKMLVQWLNLKNITHFAITNENNHSSLNRTVAMKMEAKSKSMGKHKGASDIVVLLPNKILFIELKRRRKLLKNGCTSITHTKVSKHQYEFMTMVNKFDYAKAEVCYGFDEAKELILSSM